VLGGLAPAAVDFNTAGPAFWNRYHAYRRKRQAETRPDDPIRPDAMEQDRLMREDPFELRYQYEIEHEGSIVSWLSCSTSRPGTAGHEKNQHLFWADLYVEPGHRRRRIGYSWMPQVLALMERHGCTVLGIGAEDGPARAFLRWLGADAKMEGAENRLRLADVDWELMRRWVDEGRRRSPQTVMQIYDGPLPEAMWAEFSPQLQSMLNTMPFENLDIGELVITPDHMRDWYERMELGGEIVHSALTHEPDGVMSAVSDISWAPYRPEILHQQFTGVRPEARGRGLGKWIKAAMLLHLRELYPEARWVATDNVGSNAPMLAINKKMGFKQYRAETEYQMGRDQLAARIKLLAV
jgi:mycothiol synthase